MTADPDPSRNRTPSQPAGQARAGRRPAPAPAPPRDRKRLAARAPRLRVDVCDPRGLPIAVPGLARWLVGVAPATARGTVTLVLATDARMRTLNRTYRSADCATDVLSFPTDAFALSPQPPAPSPALPRHLGDVVIARGVAARQAREAGHSVATELRVLALHGLLHLLGYDHERDAGEMARVERRLRRRGGLREGLIERAV